VRLDPELKRAPLIRAAEEHVSVSGEGAIWRGSLDEEITGKIAQRFVQEGLLTVDHDQHDLRQAINDLSQRLRHAAGEYDPAASDAAPAMSTRQRHQAGQHSKPPRMSSHT
jgi:hypothetical protein